ncbi:MAG TPA: alpha/beta hydrolase-fold protein, partial [Steroidobacteraceae bacterium]
LQRVLQGAEGIALAGIASTAEQTIEQACKLLPSVVLLDLEMARNLALQKQLGGTPRFSGVVILGRPELYAEVVACLPAEVLAFVARDATVADLLTAIRAAGGREHGVSRLMAPVPSGLPSLAPRQHSSAIAHLTEREMEILRLMQQGLPNKTSRGGSASSSRRSRTTCTAFSRSSARTTAARPSRCCTGTRHRGSAIRASCRSTRSPRSPEGHLVGSAVTRTDRSMRTQLALVCLAFVASALAADPPRPTPPTRAPDGEGAPPFTRVPPGGNAPTGTNGNFVIGPDYLPAPELTVVEGVPRGKVEQFTLKSEDSRFYPGVARDKFGTVDPANPKTLIVETHPQPWERAITVYVPAQYRRGHKAPFLVVHDGPKLGDVDMTLPHALDNLIAQKRVPAQIAILVQNGGGDAQGSERGLEYDTLSGKFAEFIEKEVLPQVEKRYGVKLTKDPEGRATMGCSSGAAAAFTMAWFHPEWYHRVISWSGTYVNQQWPFDPATPGGAWEYHTSILPDEARKPIRIWMNVGDRDLFNPNVMRDDMHDWVAANHRMATALASKGYSYQYVFALDSGHCDRKVREHALPSALEWTWRDYAPRAK